MFFVFVHKLKLSPVKNVVERSYITQTVGSLLLRQFGATSPIQLLSKLRGGEKMKEKQVDLDLTGARVLICHKNCQSLDEFRNGLCWRREREEGDKVRSIFAGPAPPVPAPDEFLVGVSAEAYEIIKVRDAIQPRYVTFTYCETDGVENHNHFPLTRNEAASVIRQEIDDTSFFICPIRRDWAEKSKIEKCVAVKNGDDIVLVDQFGAVLDTMGNELDLSIEVPLPGNPGSENIVYYPTTCKDYLGRSYFYKKKENAPEILKKYDALLFRNSPVIDLEIEESEILILQLPVISSDCGLKSVINIYRKGDKINKYTPGENRHLLKSGDTIDLLESFRSPSGWYTEEMTFENQKGKLKKYQTKGKAFAARQLEVLKSAGLYETDAWQIMRVAGPGAAVKAHNYGIGLVRQFPDKLDTLMVILDQKGPQMTNLGRVRAEGVLISLGFPVPVSRNSTEFFRILAGARKLIHFFVQNKYKSES